MTKYVKILFGFPVIITNSVEDSSIIIAKDLSQYGAVIKLRKKREIMKIIPEKDCNGCQGVGLVSGDWVDYGSTKTQLPDEYCNCVLEQLPEDYDGEIQLVLFKNISSEQLEEYKKSARNSLMTSSIGEYCPPEFMELLEYIDYLKTRLERFEKGFSKE